MKRKALFVVVFLMLLSLILGGCGKKEVSEPWEGLKGLKAKKLNFYFPSYEHNRLGTILKQLEKKARNKINVDLKFYFSTGWEFHKNYIISQVNAGEKVDAFLTEPWYIHDFMKAGVVKDITELFPRYAPDYYTKFSKEKLKQVTYDGKLLAIPWNGIPWTDRVCAIVRSDMVSKYDIRDISNYTEYENFLKIIKQNEPKLTPTFFDNESLGLFAEANGYAIFDYGLGLVYKRNDPLAKLVPWETTSCYKDSVETINRWKTNGYMDERFNTWPLLDLEIASGRYAGFLRDPGTSVWFNNVIKRSGGKFKYTEFDLYPDLKSSKYISEYGLAFNSKSPDVDRAIMFVEWLQSDQENYDLLMYGIKGEDYQMDSNGQPQLLDGDNPDRAYMNWWGKDVFYNSELAHLDTKLKKLLTRTVEDKCEYPALAGFQYDIQSLYADRTSIGNKRNAFFSERAINNGNYSIDLVNRSINDQKSIINEISADIQNKIDQWLAAKKK